MTAPELPVNANACLLAASLCLLTGLLVGAALEAHAWRLSARGRSGGHKSAGRWYDVRPRGNAACRCDLCQSARRRLLRHEGQAP